MVSYGMVGKLSADPEDRDTLVQILIEAADLMKTLDDCHMYAVSKDANDAGAVWVIELWATQEAHDQSLTLPEVRALIGKAMPILKGSPEGTTLLPVGGKGL